MFVYLIEAIKKVYFLKRASGFGAIAASELFKYRARPWHRLLIKLD